MDFALKMLQREDSSKLLNLFIELEKGNLWIHFRFRVVILGF